MQHLTEHHLRATRARICKQGGMDRRPGTIRTWIRLHSHRAMGSSLLLLPDSPAAGGPTAAICRRRQRCSAR